MSEMFIEIENCYGIKRLSTKLDFSEGNTHIIYAPNGSMKSSFARVFKDIKDDSKPIDRIFNQRISSFTIKYENQPVDPKKIVIVDPYIEDFSNQRINTLLATEELKNRYDVINIYIKKRLDEFMVSMSEHLKIKGNPAKEMYTAFPEAGGDLVKCIFLLQAEISQPINYDFSWIDYSIFFNDKAITFLQSSDTKELLEEYSTVFNNLIEKSHYFRKSGFNHNSAIDVSKGLSSSGFFDAKHFLVLADNENKKVEVLNQKEFDQIINNERNMILTDKDLRSRFDKIDKAITKNVELRQLRFYLEKNQSLSSELKDLDSFRKKAILSFSKNETERLTSFTNSFTAGKKEIEEITAEAKKQKTNWENVVTIFNERFSVPFEIVIANKEDVILKDETASIVFKYTDNGEVKLIGKDDLIAVLSVGERRAYHILNIIYEIENRKNNREDTILIIDDIADSFDYKNKYAIVQYLKDIADYPGFLQIILTHNFDFFRTVQSRLHIGRKSNCHMTIKEKQEIKIVKAEYLDPFTYYRNNLSRNEKITIAAIPFIRNISEYTLGESSDTYKILTSLLHIKSNTYNITVNDYEELVNKMLNTSYIFEDRQKKVIDLIFEVARSCNDDTESINLEKKIVLAIAIRLLTEKYIIDKLGMSSLDDITANQTVELINKYVRVFPKNLKEIELFENVILITPENIHLNSFMYEPLLDMSDHHLCDLFTKIERL